jgi:hypothetical protein
LNDFVDDLIYSREIADEYYIEVAARYDIVATASDIWN